MNEYEHVRLLALEPGHQGLFLDAFQSKDRQRCLRTESLLAPSEVRARARLAASFIFVVSQDETWPPIAVGMKSFQGAPSVAEKMAGHAVQAGAGAPSPTAAMPTGA